MLPSTAVMPSEVNSSSWREKVWPSRTKSMPSTSSTGRMVSPLTCTDEMVNTSPSVTLAPIVMSRRSGLIATWVDSTLKST